MECVETIFPIILYILGSILLVALIVLVIKVIITLKKADKVIEDLEQKSSKLNGLFDMVDNTTDAISQISDKMINFAVNGISRLFSRKSGKGDNNEEE